MPADLVLYNAQIYTMDSQTPYAEAIAVAGRHILAVGSDQEMLDLQGPNGRVIDLMGRTVVPGFIDSHVHFALFSLSLQRANLTGTASKAEAIERVRARAETLPPDAWIEGGGWDRNLWSNPSFPDRQDLDAVSPRNPIALYSKDVHSTWANSLALSMAGISRDTPDPAGGEIVRDAEGNPTGILRETAQVLLYDVKLPPKSDAVRAALRAGLAHAASVGITGFHDCEDERVFIAFQKLEAAQELTCRVYMHLAASNLDAAIKTGLRTGFGNDRLRIGGLKLFADGALGSRSAYMLEPYTNDAANRGIQVTDGAALRDLIGRASHAGISAVVHAIGDAANREVLDAFEAVRQTEPAHRLRHRMEHVQILNEADIPRLAQLDVIASMQPQHATADIDLVEAYWSGERIRGAYAWRSLLRARTKMAFGSDCPVETMSPLSGIHAAVTRRRVNGYPGSAGWRPEECLTVMEAVQAYTTGAAYASGEEALKGSLTPGKLADLAVLSHDIFHIPPMTIPETRVDLTVFDGHVLYEREPAGGR
jgi:predicted amidohydrolase YtcJ